MNIVAAQSGGPTAAINASLLGVYREARENKQIERIFGARNGIEGFLQEKLVELNGLFDTEEQAQLLRQTPSTVLGSCRYKLPPVCPDEKTYVRIFDLLDKYQIGAFFYIGGNDSMDTIDKLAQYGSMIGSPIRFIGIPKTIDNDLMHTDHTPGFGSAAKYVATTVQEIIRDSSVYALNSVTIIEIMGRNAGWLTASVCVLRKNGEVAPHLVYLPEKPFRVSDFIRDVKEVQKRHKAVIVAVSEGIRLDFEDHADDGRHQVLDGFGHVGQLAGAGKALERFVRRELGCKVRAVELNVMQRCSSHLASMTDLREAEAIGREGVKAAISGVTGVMMSIRRLADEPYQIEIVQTRLHGVAGLEKHFPEEWITAEGNQIRDEAIPYFFPLIQGDLPLLKENGLPILYSL